MNFGWLKLSPKILNFYHLDAAKEPYNLGFYRFIFSQFLFAALKCVFFWYPNELAEITVLYRGQVLEILLNGLVEPGRAESK